jgi:hypothetical protein
VSDEKLPVENKSFFTNIPGFEEGQRLGTALMKSDLIPTQFRGSLPNTMIALEIANRIGASPLAVMQNLYVVHGRPSWSGAFIIAMVNSSGRFRSTLKFRYSGSGDNYQCVAYAIDNAGEEVIGTPVTIKMAKGEGWWSKKDRHGNECSKWQTMPQLMITYRAATFFGRQYVPDLLMGMSTVEEVIDIGRDYIDAEVVLNQEDSVANAINSEISTSDEPAGPTGKTTKIDEKTTGQSSTPSAAAQKIIDVADKFETKSEVDKYRANTKNRKAIDDLGDEAAKIYAYLETVYSQLPEKRDK